MNDLPTPAPAQAETDASRFNSLVPKVAWLVVFVVLLFIPLRIMEYGFLPGGDARRHIAKAFTDKPYTQILVLQPIYSMDHSPGWEWLLRQLQKAFHWNADALAMFSVVGLVLCLFYAPLPFLRRPEAWLAALLAQLVAIPELMIRLVQARPLLITEAVLVAILFGWSRGIERPPTKLKLILTTLGIALSVWMHGAWYLWALPLMAFGLARMWRSLFWLGLCIAAGIVAGAIFTGKPWEFLRQALGIAGAISREHLPQWLLVGELRPSYGEFDSVILAAVVFLGTALLRKRRPTLFHQPALCLLIIGWILGFKADRFWADWGVAAALVWLTLQFEEILREFASERSVKRLAWVGLLAFPLFLHATNDLDRRYSASANTYFLDGQDPTLKGWMPGKNGIFYNAQMEFFYNTFYKNPTADWRYILGLEPALMPEEDLNILRRIQRNNYAVAAYEPWADKLTSRDRLVIYSLTPPDLRQLEWHDAGGNIWLGRKPEIHP